jgi:16S rRNA C967 or C1407 C5-methylase (RsmB/RsmF family)
MTAPQASLKKVFRDLWEEIFSSHVRVDSALSKLTAQRKQHLAPVLKSLLLRPIGLAAHLGVGLKKGEPWNLGPKELSKFLPAFLVADRLLEMREGGRLDLLRQYFEKGTKDPRAPSAEEEFPPSMRLPLRGLHEFLCSPAKLSLRVALRGEINEVLGEIPHSTRSKISPVGVVVPQWQKVLHLPMAERGLVAIQDEGSQLLARYALNARDVSWALSSTPQAITGDSPLSWGSLTSQATRVVDSCAGAGGKTLAMADFLGGGGSIFAYDVSEKKLQALRKRAIHHGFQNIKSVLLIPGREEERTKKFEKTADVVLVDAPCSGWGVLRRNPDIKWRQNIEEIVDLERLQARLLSVYAPLVKSGGRLVYGVCTFRNAETEDQVQKFSHSSLGTEFELEECGYLGPGPCDGFFIASWRRR